MMYDVLSLQWGLMKFAQWGINTILRRLYAIFLKIGLVNPVDLFDRLLIIDDYCTKPVTVDTVKWWRVFYHSLVKHQNYRREKQQQQNKTVVAVLSIRFFLNQ